MKREEERKRERERERERERSGAASPEDWRKERFPTTDRRLRVATSSILSAFLFPLPFFLLCSGAVGSRPAAMAEKKSNVDDINEIYECMFVSVSSSLFFFLLFFTETYQLTI